MAGGRPTKYNKEILRVARDYLENYEEYGDAIPSHAGLAVALKINKSTVYAWKSDDHPEFSDTLDDIMSKQEQVLLTKGLQGEFNPTIAKLAMANHNYSDKVHQDNTSSDGTMTPSSKLELTGEITLKGVAANGEEVGGD